MKIISTNIAEPTIITWNGREETTGIYKKPTSDPIFLSKEDVRNDEVSDRVYHGEIYKACYMFSSEQYPYWQALYPDLDWTHGMFGENLTVSGFDEQKVMVGDVYKVGEAVVRVSQSREPCYKLGLKFGTQKVLKQFIEHGYGGTYLSIVQEGHVAAGDEFELIERSDEHLSVVDLFALLFSKQKNPDHLKRAIRNEAIPAYKKEWFSSFVK